MNTIKKYGYLMLVAGLTMGLLSSCATKQETKKCTMGEMKTTCPPAPEAQNDGQVILEKEKSSACKKSKKCSKKHKKSKKKAKKSSVKKSAVTQTEQKTEAIGQQAPVVTEPAPAPAPAQVPQNVTPTMEAGKEMAPKAPEQPTQPQTPVQPEPQKPSGAN